MSTPSQESTRALVSLLAKQQFIQCEEMARTMTEQFADHALGWSVLAVCLAQTGRLADAVPPMRKAVSLQPSSAALQNNLGNILHDKGRFDEAVACFRRRWRSGLIMRRRIAISA